MKLLLKKKERNHAWPTMQIMHKCSDLQDNWKRSKSQLEEF